jgi:hypothetical protein
MLHQRAPRQKNIIFSGTTFASTWLGLPPCWFADKWFNKLHLESMK